MALNIARKLLDELRRYSELAYPHESCGILVGHAAASIRTVERAIACANTTAASPRTSYEISPSDLLHVQREARLAGEQILGFYHSHPDHPAHWSATDLAQAHWPGCSYLILSVKKGRAAAVHSFLLLSGEHRFEDEEIHLL